jgi:transposase
VAPPGVATVINDRCVVRTSEGRRVVVTAGLVFATYAAGDRAAEALAMVSLVDAGWAKQVEVARAFQCSPRTVRRYERRFEEGGLAGLVRSAGYPQGRPRLPATRQKTIERLKARYGSNREVARRLGVTEKAIRKVLRRLGWKEPALEQMCLPLGLSGDAESEAPSGRDAAAGADPNVSASRAGGADPNVSASGVGGADPNVSASRAGGADPNVSASGVGGADPNVSALDGSDEVAPASYDADPSDRRVDRLLACLGLLDDAAPLFGSATHVPQAGVLLALPALVDSGVFAVARAVYGSLGPAFYGLRTTFLTLLLMALLRIKRPEGLKEVLPVPFGQVLGLDRAPEVKTLRRKLARLGQRGRAAAFGRALALRRVAAHGAALGFLYVDGHVRVYHGRQRLPKTHITQLRTALPATTDYWVNDREGDPLLVLTADANAGLVKMLPPILAEIRALVGPRRVTIVFDRGGYSPDLFRHMLADGFDVLTYRKGRFPPVPADRFSRHEAVLHGQHVAYDLADEPVDLLAGKLRLRQVTRLCDDGHQTPILTSRDDLPAVDIAYRMFARWRQENFFKYLKEEFALDALVDYDVLPDDPARSVPNPARRTVEAELRKARAACAKLQAEYGSAALANPEQRRPTMRGFKIAHGKLGQRLRAAMQLVATLDARRAALPERVPVGDTHPDAVVKLATERKLLTNLVKMVAYQAETDLSRVVAPHYARAEDEGRTLIQNALDSHADLDVRDGELRITLDHLSSSHRTRAIAALCVELNRNPVLFPGTKLRVRYSVRPDP